MNKKISLVLSKRDIQDLLKEFNELNPDCKDSKTMIYDFDISQEMIHIHDKTIRGI